MKIKPPVLLLTTMTALVLLSGCKEKTTTEKVADKANTTADKTTDAVKDGAKKVSDSVEKAYDKTKEAVKDGAHAVKDGVQKAGETIKEGAQKTEKEIEKLVK